MILGEVNESKEHRWKPGIVVLIWMTFLVLIAFIVFSALPQLDTPLFESDIGDLSDKYNLDVTPAGWTFTIWSVIYVAQVIMCLYFLTLTCRRNELSRGKLYYDPPFLPPSFYAVYMLACIACVAWLFTFDSEYLVGSMVALLVGVICLYVCIFIAIKLLFQYEPELSRKELWLNIILVHNALGIFATWVTVASALNVGIVIRYVSDYSMEAACWSALGGVATLLVIHFFVDMFVLTVRYRYFFTPYLTIIVASAGIVEENLDWDVDYQILAVAILIASVVMVLIKIVVVVVRAVRSPSPLEIDE